MEFKVTLNEKWKMEFLVNDDGTVSVIFCDPESGKILSKFEGITPDVMPKTVSVKANEPDVDDKDDDEMEEELEEAVDVMSIQDFGMDQLYASLSEVKSVKSRKTLTQYLIGNSKCLNALMEDFGEACIEPDDDASADMFASAFTDLKLFAAGAAEEFGYDIPEPEDDTDNKKKVKKSSSEGKKKKKKKDKKVQKEPPVPNNMIYYGPPRRF